MNELPTPKWQHEFSTHQYDYGHLTSIGLDVSVGHTTLSRAVRFFHKGESVNTEHAKNLLLRWFWRKLGAV